MRKLVYYVATSLDGYIAGPNESIDLFAMDGSLVEKYQQDLRDFDTVVMGRKTYEFGYKFGLPPGQPAYPHMRHYIFSDSLTLENPHDLVKVVKRDTSTIKQLKQEEGTDIYLCGGGAFAGWMLDEKLIDILIIKLNPIVLGSGTPLFGDSNTATKLNQLDNQEFEGGLSLRTYHIHY